MLYEDMGVLINSGFMRHKIVVLFAVFDTVTTFPIRESRQQLSGVYSCKSEFCGYSI